MLKQAEYSFVMANATPDMFTYGNYKAKSHEENSVLQVIHEYVFSSKRSSNRHLTFFLIIPSPICESITEPLYLLRTQFDQIQNQDIQLKSSYIFHLERITQPNKYPLTSVTL